MNFWDNKSIEELAREQGVDPLADISDREWTQDELREHLRSKGITCLADGEELPQCVKYVNPAPLTPEEIAWAKGIISQHPEN